MAPVLSLVTCLLVLVHLDAVVQGADAGPTSTPRAQTDTTTYPAWIPFTHIYQNITVPPPPIWTTATGPELSGIAGILGALVPGGTSSLLSGLLQTVGGSGFGGGNQASLTMAVMAAKMALSHNNVSDRCQEDLYRMATGLQALKPWAVQMLDAAGKPNSGILDTIQTVKFLGNYDQCVGVEATGSDANNDSVTYFRGRHCLAVLNLHDLPIIQGGKVTVFEGMCVPDGCSSEDVQGVLTTAQHLIYNFTVRYETQTFCHTEKEVDTEAKAVIAVLGILCALLVIGTVYDVIVMQLKWTSTDDRSPASAINLIDYRKEAEPVEAVSKEGNSLKTTDNGGADNTLATNGSVKETDVRLEIRHNVANSPQNKESTVERILLAFSVYNNGCKLLSTHQSSGSLGSIHGIRFLSMAWVILGHTYFFSQNYAKNVVKHIVFEKMQQWTFMFVPYATVAVDSFFLLSGILVAYLTLRELKKVGGALKLNWFMFFFHRFWRLTPPYMLIMMTGTVLVPYLSSGPLWNPDSETIMGKCRDNWWTNLLYINNYVKSTPDEGICMGWTWYLANDMQFYIISPLILLPIFYNFAQGAICCAAFMAATLITTALVAKTHEYNAQTFVDLLSPPKDGRSFKNIYEPSYARMGPYTVGLFVGYILYRWNSKRPERPRIPAVLKRLMNVWLWVLAIGVCCVVTYTPYNKDGDHVFSKNQSVTYLTLSRTAWAIALGWMIVSCAWGYGGWINQVLSWKAFIPLGRLTYCAYLVHPIVQMTYMSSTRSPFYFTDYSAAYLFFGHIVTSYGVAFIVSLAFESPMMGLEKAIFRRGK